MLLANRIALVTGAGQGNGAAIAKGMAGEGARVIVTDIDPEKADAVASAIRDGGGQADAFRLDVANAEACDQLAATIARDIGDVSALVNNAGVCPRHTIDAPDLRRHWRQAMDVNLDGALNVTLAFLPALRRSRGAIINISSIAAFAAGGNSISYCASKSAIKMMTQNLAHELAKDGVRVNAIAPGAFATPMTAATRADPEKMRRFTSRAPLGRYGEPEELVGPAVFLASPMSSYVTGACLVVDGGYLAS